MATLKEFSRLGAQEHGLVMVATARRDGSVQASVVNAGVLAHPSGGDVVGLVARGDALKLRMLRERPRATVTVRSGWQWVTVEGPVELAGPDDPHPAFPAEEIPQLLRDVFTAAGGTHDDWDEYDRVMATERRTAVLVHPERVYGVA
jgi:PPOX class probable F420-dependent enzyme